MFSRKNSRTGIKEGLLSSNSDKLSLPCLLIGIKV